MYFPGDFSEFSQVNFRKPKRKESKTRLPLLHLFCHCLSCISTWSGSRVVTVNPRRLHQTQCHLYVVAISLLLFEPS